MKQSGRPGWLFVVAAAVSVLAAGTLEAEIVQKCVNEAEGFSIEFPEGWRLQENPSEGVSLVAFRPPEKEGESVYEMMKVVCVEDTEQDFGAFLQRYIDVLQDNLAAFTLISEGSEAWSGLEARVLVYTFTDTFFTLKVLGKAKQWIVKKGKRVYLITGGATVESFPRYEEAFGRIAGTFRPL